MIGAGGIVNDAHLPAYVKSHFPIAGIYDIDSQRSHNTAAKFGISTVYKTLADALASENVVFDVAIPPGHLIPVLEQLNSNSAVLMQKPMGNNLEEARQIVAICEKKKLTAAVNFQLRFSPMMLTLKDIIARNLIGPIVDVDVHLNYRDPWELFPFLESQARVEMLIVSIHYFDWLRSLLGEPIGVYARSIPHPRFPKIEATRTSAILNYGNRIRCCLSLNNTWQYGPEYESCVIRVEGMKGAIIIKLGGLINYPNGEADTLEYTVGDKKWFVVPLAGNWFPDAFQGPMANLQRFVNGEDDLLLTNVDDAQKTMALVEALYESSNQGGVNISI